MSDPSALWLEALASGAGRTPYVNALGGEVFVLEPGKVRMRLPYSAKIIGDPDTGVVHGGVITGFLDQSCGMAIGSKLREPGAFVTLDLRIDYMKPAKPQLDLTFDGECIKVAHEVAFARAFAYQESIEDPVAIATGTFMFTTTGFVPMSKLR